VSSWRRAGDAEAVLQVDERGTDEVARWRSRLEERRRVLEDRLDRGEGSGGFHRGERSEGGELSLYDNHPADSGTTTYERGKDLGWLSSTEIALHAVDEALKRLEEGRYGVCESCGAPISPERLEAVPETTLCVECRRRTREPFDPFARPPEEDAQGVPFSMRPPRGRSDGHLRLEAWEDVEQYGTATEPGRAEGRQVIPPRTVGPPADRDQE